MKKFSCALLIMLLSVSLFACSSSSSGSGYGSGYSDTTNDIADAFNESPERVEEVLGAMEDALR